MIDETQNRYQIEFHCNISTIENKFQITTIDLRAKAKRTAMISLRPRKFVFPLKFLKGYQRICFRSSH